MGHDFAKITGVIYISLTFGLMNSFFYYGNTSQFQVGLIIGLFTLTWTSDVMAYLTGSLFGKPQAF